MRNKFNKLVAIFIFLAAISFAQISGLATEPTNTNIIPKNFKAKIESFKGSSYWVELQDGLLVYVEKKLTNTIQIKITPTTEQWREFRGALDHLNVWQWESRFNNYDVLDGTSWALSIQYRDHGLSTRGRNGYPDKSGKLSKELEPTKSFQAYLRAVQKLLGGKDFK